MSQSLLPFINDQDKTVWLAPDAITAVEPAYRKPNGTCYSRVYLGRSVFTVLGVASDIANRRDQALGLPHLPEKEKHGPQSDPH